MEAIYSSETLVATQQTTRRHIPEDDTLQLLPWFIKHVVALVLNGSVASFYYFLRQKCI
jgi:hypothetical protein